MLEGFYFDDCLLLDFTVAPDLSFVQIVSEVQYVSTKDPQGRMGHIKVRLENIEEIQLHLLPGFHKDLTYAYDYKGNEVYEFTFESRPDEKIEFTLRADLLSVKLTCSGDSVRYFVMS